MHETPLDLAAIAAFWLAPSIVLFFLLRKEARETRAKLDALESRLQSSFEQLTGEFADLQVKHFGLSGLSRSLDACPTATGK